MHRSGYAAPEIRLAAPRRRIETSSGGEVQHDDLSRVQDGGPNGVNVSLLAPGTCTITADQQGNASYNPAPPVTQSFLVSKADQTISFGPLSDKRLAEGGLL